ncbi:hypothetical protein Lsed01_00854 [Demequina sediminis]|uniref:Gamma-glutamylcyclotransferase AIG2-like domain-containing protein n=1 Tax=Demequina sediminis TaxID=1930058 RepID=A0ABP9WF19_9MICO|nr:gamma-glutamylcyclotransferase [Demequina sediminis]BDZ62492.1 hypothetical protein GCM10025873_22830 [Demequina sediminis]
MTTTSAHSAHTPVPASTSQMHARTRQPERDAATPVVSAYGELALPYLVYGTLREGQGNSWAIERGQGRYVGTTHLKGFDMYMPPHGAFPYVAEGAGTVTVEIVQPPASDSARRRLREHLDRLEGFVVGKRWNHYDRVAVRFSDPRDGGMLRWGWLYAVTDPDARLDLMPKIEGGDWVERER